MAHGQTQAFEDAHRPFAVPFRPIVVEREDVVRVAAVELVIVGLAHVVEQRGDGYALGGHRLPMVGGLPQRHGLAIDLPRVLGKAALKGVVVGHRGRCIIEMVLAQPLNDTVDAFAVGFNKGGFYAFTIGSVHGFVEL